MYQATHFQRFTRALATLIVAGLFLIIGAAPVWAQTTTFIVTVEDKTDAHPMMATRISSCGALDRI